jgi:hypothetical protein
MSATPATNNHKLYPCLICGSSNNVVTSEFVTGIEEFYVLCVDCCEQSDNANTRLNAIRTHNTMYIKEFGVGEMDEENSDDI